MVWRSVLADDWPLLRQVLLDVVVGEVREGRRVTFGLTVARGSAPFIDAVAVLLGDLSGGVDAVLGW